MLRTIFSAEHWTRVWLNSAVATEHIHWKSYDPMLWLLWHPCRFKLCTVCVHLFIDSLWLTAVKIHSSGAEIHLLYQEPLQLTLESAKKNNFVSELNLLHQYMEMDHFWWWKLTCILRLCCPLARILQIQAYAVFQLLCMGKTNSLFPVSVYSEFTLQALSIQHLSSWYPVFKITSNPPWANVSPSFSRQQSHLQETRQNI